ncbi:Dual specificity phosphatase, catalytic domain [Phaeobacter sp. CECT 5382]|uniref:protein-tyrosine phosphatase family protein n=1 Tax=Phaeobacter sp. CECT 5382 TaxID=1712645 RepID=UPI0006DBD0C8|nr:dual specificity protein phosphatase family protein [Phaeobacter sp. CECT 5382]CUH88138.1 Dual specificity phosphatase, catalytic domain [Phaeobacter sp. CECT 5382]
MDGKSAAASATSLSLHALCVGDGILALCPLPGAGGDYAGDMEHIHDWQPGLVISMTTEVEHVAVGAHDLGQAFQSMGCRWVHVPVPDFAAPTETMLQSWPEISAMARQTLAGGGRVLIHCRGGCGRSGMVVLRLMIEAGEYPAKALIRLRKVRPCAVETEAQMQWATEPEADQAP